MTIYQNTIPIASITDCDHEPIHIPGSIQPHGYLIACIGFSDTSEASLLSVSENFLLDAKLQKEEIHSLRLRDVLDENSIIAIRHCLHGISKQEKKSLILNPLQTPHKRLCSNLHTNEDGILIIEMELPSNKTDDSLLNLPQSDSSPFSENELVENLAMDFVFSKIQSFNHIQNISELHQTFADVIRSMTGYDRVMVYKFDEKWNGEVIAESKRADLLPFLNLRYPASDIPLQARELYKKNLIRWIPDIFYRPTPLLSISPLPLNLSSSILRSVSPLHVEYLGNMGVSGTMTISLMVKGELWGMVACHHYKPKWISIPLRNQCALLSQVFSFQLIHKLESEERAIEKRAFEIQQRLIDDYSMSSQIGRSLLNGQYSLLQLIPADGVAILFDDTIYTAGETPSHSDIRELSKRIQFSEQQKNFFTNSLKLQTTDVASATDPQAYPFPGVLAINLSKIKENRIIWFRKEVIETILWSGEPHKAVTKTGKDIPRLHPRKSFDAWKEEVKGTSKPWTNTEIWIAQKFQSAILQTLLAKREEIQALIDQVSHKNIEIGTIRSSLEEKEILLKEIHHRVKNNLQVVSSLLYLQQSQAAHAEFTTLLSESINRINSMAVVHELLYNSESLSHISLKEYFEKLISNIRLTYDISGINVNIHLDIPDIHIYLEQGIPCGLILNELLSNSFKHAFKDKKTGTIKIDAKLSPVVGSRNRTIEWSYQDDGMGLPENLNPKEVKTLGLTLVRSLTIQLDGKYSLENINPSGLRFLFSFAYKEKN